MHLRAFLLAIAVACGGPLVAQQAQPPAPLTPEVLQQLLKRFPDADANKDGILTAEEARAYREKTQPTRPPAAQRPTAPTPTYADAHYGPHERNVLDFWAAKSDRPTPVLVFIHGGGFVAGGKEQVSPGNIAACLSSGVSFASISYRYTTQAPYPAPMLDGARAIQFLRSKAGEWNIDPKRIGAFGGSAGAGISMWLGFHDDLAKPESADPIERQSSRLTCVGSIGGQSSYDPVQIREWLGGRAWEHPAFKPFYTVKTNEEFEKPEVRKLAYDASVINHLTKDDAPVFMFYSEPDEPLSNDSKPGTGIHHPKFGHILKEKMDALGIEAVYRHAQDGRQPPGPEAMIEWLKQHLLAPSK
ncbi:MAG TPA: alpha/beta hydrolase [Chthoniobacteraceae bacterium]|jgi:acetyl esterase/lipase|nr:alpha/beta hydrolase [Chthoniobacteraceae bacterium]